MPMITLTTVLVVCFAIISTTNWIQPSDPLLFRADYTLSVGFYNGSIYLLGGYNQPKQLTEYVIADNLFIDHGLEALNTNKAFGIFGYAQYWIQINHILYVEESYGFNNDNKVSIFNMKTKTFTSSVIEGIPTDGGINSCMTSNSTHIFLVGGISDDGSFLSLVQIYDLSSNEWITSAPSMNSARADFACIIHSINGKLYAIGGTIATASPVLSSIEVIQTSDIAHKTWIYINDTLSQGLAWSLCTIYKHNIYVIGGADINDVTTKTVHIINALTDEVSELSDQMPIGLCCVAPIVVNHKLYVFGGWNNDNTGGINTWMMYDLYIPTASPTEEPTASPTEEPTKSTSFPTTLSTEPSAHTTTSLTTTADTKTTLEASQDSITFMPTTANIMTSSITTKAVTSKPTTKNIIAFIPTTNDITLLASTKQMASDTSHVTTDLLAIQQDKEAIPTLNVVRIAMIILAVIIALLIVVISYCRYLKKQSIKVKKDIEFVGKSDHNANNNEPEQYPEIVDEAENQNKINVNHDDDDESQTDSSHNSMYDNHVAQTDFATTSGTSGTSGETDKDKNVEQLPVAVEGPPTHRVRFCFMPSSLI